MAAISVKVKGAASAALFLKSKGKEVFNLANDAINKAGFFIEGEVKESIAGHRAEPRSVDTGRFLNSVKNVQEKPLTSIVKTNVKYADTLEFGTSKRRPRRHFNNTAKRNQRKVSDFVERELNSL